MAISEDDRDGDTPEPEELHLNWPELLSTLAHMARLPTEELLQQADRCEGLQRWRIAVSPRLPLWGPAPAGAGSAGGKPGLGPPSKLQRGGVWGQKLARRCAPATLTSPQLGRGGQAGAALGPGRAAGPSGPGTCGWQGLACRAPRHQPACLLPPEHRPYSQPTCLWPACRQGESCQDASKRKRTAQQGGP